MDFMSSKEPSKEQLQLPIRIDSIDSAHSLVHQYISQFKEGYFPALTNLCRLVEEVGELSRELNHQFGGKLKRPEDIHDRTREELGDIFFTLVVLANQLEVDLGEALGEVLQKYQSRDATRWTQEIGRAHV